MSFCKVKKKEKKKKYYNCLWVQSVWSLPEWVKQNTPLSVCSSDVESHLSRTFVLSNQEVIGAHHQTATVKTSSSSSSSFKCQLQKQKTKQVSCDVKCEPRSRLSIDSAVIYGPSSRPQGLILVNADWRSVLPSRQLSKLLMAITLAVFPHVTSHFSRHAAMLQEFYILHDVAMHPPRNLTI